MNTSFEPASMSKEGNCGFCNMRIRLDSEKTHKVTTVMLQITKSLKRSINGIQEGDPVCDGCFKLQSNYKRKFMAKHKIENLSHLTAFLENPADVEMGIPRSESDTSNHATESLRPRRKKKDYRETGIKGKTQRMYDNSGIFLKDNEDFCDCLVDDCPGCHFPCEKCRSPKCGHECRQNRKWTYEKGQVEGSSEPIINSHIHVPFAKQLEKLKV